MCVWRRRSAVEHSGTGNVPKAEQANACSTVPLKRSHKRLALIVLPDDLFLFPPPFGFRGLQYQLTDLLQLLPESSSELRLDRCSRCVVVGNGGILKGLELGAFIDQFDVIIRSQTHTPKDQPPYELSREHASALGRLRPGALLVLCGIVSSLAESPGSGPHRVQQVQTLKSRRDPRDGPGPAEVSASETSILGLGPEHPDFGRHSDLSGQSPLRPGQVAGFGYQLSQQGAPLHYYDHLAMDAILQQKMHNVNRETELLRGLVRAGTISDLTGGIQAISR
ncbi:hypothetical protein WMY93_008720 [Mugilogobius chulae]|uniref:Lactosylceramide alpha-2,3-sialyltransferase n=1 Tax=Mugilogobius chulae TaxID=88201 RepID=A0AAW0PCY3_9GOBI